jgi:ADP-heptose:LPS heptosyltransferase
MLTTRRTRPVIESLASIDARSIAVLQIGKLGDMILTTPLFSALKLLYREAALTVILAPGTTAVPASHPAVDDLLVMPRGFLRQLPALTRTLRERKFDLYIDIKDHRSTTSRLIAELIRARGVIAHSSAIRGNHRAHALPPANPPGHFVDKALAPLKLLAPGETFARRPTIAIPLDAHRTVDDQLDPGVNGIIAINISAGDASRYWEPEKWRQTIGKLGRRYNIAVLSSPADRALADEICSTRKGARPIRTDDILQAAAVVDRSLAVITPDTSIVHLASALDRPCIGLYPPNEANARTFAPMSTKHRVIMPPEGRSFQDITVEEVVGAVGEVLGRGVDGR